MPTKENIDCIIIGAGPAGLSAAIQAKRQGLSVAVFEKGRPGGQALAANLIENFPGFPEGITGAALMERFLKQAKAHGVEIEKREVKQITDSDSDSEYRIITDSEDIRCRSVIVACGLKPKQLKVTGEEGLIGKKIFYYSDPATISHRGKHVVVIGSGDAAFDQAINFSRRAKKVAVLMRGNTTACIPKLYKAAVDSGIEIIKNARIKCFKETGRRFTIDVGAAAKTHKNSSSSRGLTAGSRDSAIKSRNDNHEENSIKQKSTIEADVAIICIGKELRIPFIDSKLATKNVPGLFWAGDCLHGRHRHIAIAVGDGTLAAMKAADYINGTK